MLQTSGRIGLNDLNGELGIAGGTSIRLNDPRVRALGSPTPGGSLGNPLSLSQFYGKRRPSVIATVSSYSGGTAFSRNCGICGDKGYPGYLGATTSGIRITNFMPIATNYWSDASQSTTSTYDYYGNVTSTASTYGQPNGDTSSATLAWIHPYSTLTSTDISNLGFVPSQVVRGSAMTVTYWAAYVNSYLQLNYAGVYAGGATNSPAFNTAITGFSDPWADVNAHTDITYFYLPDPPTNMLYFLNFTEDVPKSFYRTVNVSYQAYN